MQKFKETLAWLTSNISTLSLIPKYNCWFTDLLSPSSILSQKHWTFPLGFRNAIVLGWLFFPLARHFLCLQGGGWLLNPLIRLPQWCSPPVWPELNSSPVLLGLQKNNSSTPKFNVTNTNVTRWDSPLSSLFIWSLFSWPCLWQTNTDNFCPSS